MAERFYDPKKHGAFPGAHDMYAPAGRAPETGALRPETARLLSATTKSPPVMQAVSPRWLLKLLPWVPVEAGVYRVNRLSRAAADDTEKPVLSDFRRYPGERMTGTYPEYDETPREYMLSVIQTILRLSTYVTDIFNTPFDQRDEQARLTIEAIQERQEWEIINDPGIGLINSVARGMRVRTRKGSPSPDDMDELLAKVWKKPAFFLAHPRAIAALCRECTKRGVPPATVNLFGSPFLTWRGVPVIPCDKLLIDGRTETDAAYGKTAILLMRTGEKEQGVIGLNQPGIPDECEVPSLSVRLAGIDDRGVASYILSLYFSVAVLSGDALGMLEDVEIGNYYDYK